MKRTTIQQEVLFFTGTSFAQKELHFKNPAADQKASQHDKLEMAFWNGLLYEMLPELKAGKDNKQKSFLWQINTYNASLWLNLGNKPGQIDHEYSVDPYQFVAGLLHN